MFQQTTTPVLISRPKASIKYDRSQTTMWRDESAGIIPAAIRINNRKFWIESELDRAYGLTSDEVQS